MGIISAGFKISQTIKNINRLREIVTIFARHGFDEFIPDGVIRRIPGFVLPKATKNKIKEELEKIEESKWTNVIGLRLRLCFEELGPAFVKFGQLFASREDIFDEGFINQMKLLRDKVKPLNFSEVKNQVEVSLGVKIDTMFEYIQQEPIGTASIGLVYKGKLINGKEVVLKVRRPGIADLIDTDLSLMLFIAKTAEKVGSEFKYLGLSRILEDFSLSLHNEFNFNLEALNCSKIRKIIDKYNQDNIFYIPHIYEEFTAKDLIVMELVEGIPFSDDKKITQKLGVLEDKLNFAVRIFIKSFLNEGVFHADLHGGNFFFTPDERIALIDFGLVGTLSRSARQNLVSIIYAILNNNYETLVNEFLDVAQYEEIPNVERLVADMKSTLSPFVGLTIKQTDFTVVLKLIMRTLREHEIFLPSDWYIVFRALITLDGVGKSLGLDFDIFSFLEEDIGELLQGNFKKDYFLEEAFWIGKDVLGSAKVIPRHLRWFIKEWSKNGYAFEHKHQGLEKSFDRISNALFFLGFSLFSCVLFIAGLQFLSPQVLAELDFANFPKITYLLWSSSMIMFLYGLNRS